MDVTEKEKWTEEAAKDKERFNKENTAYLAKKSLKADDVTLVEMRETCDVTLVEMRETSNKVEEASESDKDASHMLKAMEEALVKSEVVEEKAMEGGLVKSEVMEEALLQVRNHAAVTTIILKIFLKFQLSSTCD